MPDPRASGSRPAVVRPAIRPSRWWLIAGAVMLAVLAIAWIDGGERALRPISEAVEMPAAATQGAAS